MRQSLAVVLIVPSLLLGAGCASIVAPGQLQEEMVSSCALKWKILEYDFQGSHFVWIPHWQEGLLHLSSPSSSNCKKLDVLEFKGAGGPLVSVTELGDDRGKWAETLRAHGRLKQDGEQGMDPLYLAVAEKILHAGAPLEAVLFANGFPRIGADSNPRVFRSRQDIQRDDRLYYFSSRFGSAFEVVMVDGKMDRIEEAKHLSRSWQYLPTDVKP